MLNTLHTVAETAQQAASVKIQGSYWRGQHRQKEHKKTKKKVDTQSIHIHLERKQYFVHQEGIVIYLCGRATSPPV